MKKRLKLIPVLLCCSLLWAQAQNDGFRRPLEERIETQRIAFITEKVQLTPQEAQAFWPIYNAFRESEREIKAQRAPTKSILDMDEVDAVEYLELQMALEQQEHELKLRFTNDLRPVLSAKKILRFFAAERQFKERLLQLMKQRRKKTN